MSEFSLDALVVVNAMFRPMTSMKLSFKTPSRVHPRMRAALTELVEKGVLTEERMPLVRGYALDFYCAKHQREALAAVPKMSQKDMKANSFPVTVD